MFINFCQIKSLDPAESLTLDAYDEIESILSTYISKAYKLDEYGKSADASKIWDYGNKIVYLIGYLFLIRERILKDYRNCQLKTFAEYKEIYKLDCIRKTFACFSIPFDVDNLYSIFGVNSPFGFDGIDFMAIEIDNTNLCNDGSVFEIQDNLS